MKKTLLAFISLSFALISVAQDSTLKKKDRKRARLNEEQAKQVSSYVMANARK